MPTAACISHGNISGDTAMPHFLFSFHRDVTSDLAWHVNWCGEHMGGVLVYFILFFGFGLYLSFGVFL